MSATVAGMTAFRETFLNAGAANAGTFSDVSARNLRYALYWQFFQNSAYRDINNYAASLRTDYKLYKHIRNIYNPSLRLGRFWQAHVMNGTLDPLAGDGKTIQSALPIISDSPREKELRAAIAQLWLDSNWATHKDIYTLQGTIFGDNAIRVIDDTERGKVYLNLVHPGSLKSVALDPFGNVKGYEIEEQRLHPEKENSWVTYSEVASRDGDDVVYRTMLNGNLYAWNKDADGNAVAEWRVPYGFIPLVLVQHNNVGLSWGWSELHASRTKIQELDDLASVIHDQMRKLFNAPWLLAGVSESKDKKPPEAKNPTRKSDEPDRSREEVPIYFGPVGAQPHALVAPLDLASAGAELDRLIKEIEEDHPELRVLKLMLSGEVSGRALALARQPAEDEVNLIRPHYDDGLKRAQQMAISIGGYRGYEKYAAFDLDSFGDGELNHYIGQRRVFAQTPFDVSEEKTAFYGVFKAASEAGAQIPRQRVWEEAGYDKEQRAQMEQDLQKQMESNMNAVLTDVVTGVAQ